MRSIRVSFPGALAHELVGRLELPDAAPHAMALHAACFTCAKDLKAARWTSRRLCQHGIGVLRFDYMGLGESKGSFADTTFASKVADVQAAARFLFAHHGGPQILMGHSIGGAAAIVAAPQLPAVRLVVTINAPADTRRLAGSIRRRAPDLEHASPISMSFSGGRPVPISRRLVEDLESQDVLAAVGRLGRPLLIFQGTQDELLGTAAAEALFAAAEDPKSLVALPGAGHLLVSRAQDCEFIADVVAGWLAAYA